MQFKELYGLRTERKLTIEEASEVLGISERTFRRWSCKYEDEGAIGLVDRRFGKKPNNTAPVDEVLNLVDLYKTSYINYNITHFYEKWRSDHGGQRSYSWVKNQLEQANLKVKKKSRGKYRKKRERAPIEGLMLHQDASTHEWVPNKYWDLVVTMDDATSEIYSAFFVEEEGTISSFMGVKEVIEKKGLFCSFYSDRGSHYWHTPKEGGKVDKNNPTQFGRAMNALGIEMIPAYSPEARGRSERMFSTLQGRLPNELASLNITDMQKANEFLKSRFIPQINQRFTAQPASNGSAFVPYVHMKKLDEFLCLQAQRTVTKDNTVSYENKILQLPQTELRTHFIKAKVTVHEYIDGSMGVFYGHKCLAKYDQNGVILKEDNINENSESYAFDAA